MKKTVGTYFCSLHDYVYYYYYISFFSYKTMNKIVKIAFIFTQKFYNELVNLKKNSMAIPYTMFIIYT